MWNLEKINVGDKKNEKNPSQTKCPRCYENTILLFFLQRRRLASHHIELQRRQRINFFSTNNTWCYHINTFSALQIASNTKKFKKKQKTNECSHWHLYFLWWRPNAQWERIENYKDYKITWPITNKVQSQFLWGLYLSSMATCNSQKTGDCHPME